MGEQGPISNAVQAQPANQYHYLARWEWFNGPDGFTWRCPSGSCTGVIDLRSLPQRALAGGAPEGWGWFTYDTPQDICAVICTYEGTLVANGLDTPVNGRTAAVLLGVNVTASTPRAMLADLLTQAADPTGQDRWKPLLSSEIYLGGERVWQARTQWFSSNADPTWQDLAIQARQADYERLRTRNIEQARRVADFWIDEYGFDLRTGEQRQDGTLPHETTITESWDCANADDPDCDLDWTQTTGTHLDIVSNKLQSTTSGNPGYMRAESDLSSDDHYSQALVLSSTSGRSGVICRFDAAAENFYIGVQRDNASSTWRLYEVTGGTASLHETATGTLSSGEVLNKIECDGSTITYTSDGADRIIITDTSHTGFTRAGVGHLFDSQNVTWDDFQAEDLAAAPAAAPGGFVIINAP